MVYWESILFYAVITCGLGYSVRCFFWKSWDEGDLLETFSMLLGIGLAVLVVLVYLLHVFGIPMRYYYFLIASLVVPFLRLLFYVVKGEGFGLDRLSQKVRRFRLVIKKRHIYSVVLLLIFAFTLFMYLKGSFRYPYLEDTDPYEHAYAAAYIAHRGTFNHDFELDQLRYLPPYPPAFSTIMSLLYQTNGDVVWTLKFFNALIISLSILWFFYFARWFTGSRSVALFSTFVLASVPAYLSHFIFAHALAVSLMPVGFYAFARARDDFRRWWLALVLACAGVLMVQATVSVVFGLFMISFFVIYAVLEKKIRFDVFFALLGGLVLALALFWVPTIISFGGFGNIITSGSDENLWSIGLAASSSSFIYSVKDFVITQKTGGIDTQIGLGIVVSLLLVFGVVYFFFLLFSRRKVFRAHIRKDAWIPISFVLLVFTFIGVNAGRLPVMLVPLRWWPFLAFAVALFSGFAFFRILGLCKQKLLRVFITVIVVLGIVFTSIVSRYAVQTSYWPPHIWTGSDELEGYLALKTTDFKDLYPLCSQDRKIAFLDANGFWTKDPSFDNEYFGFRKGAFNTSAENISRFMRRQGYTNIIVDSTCVADYGVNETVDKVNEMVASGMFRQTFSAKGVVLLGVM